MQLLHALLLSFLIAGTFALIATDAVKCTSDDECTKNQFCARDFSDCDKTATGLCTDIPAISDCPATTEPTCGCDGITYESACQAAAASTSIFASEACVDIGDGITSRIRQNVNGATSRAYVNNESSNIQKVKK